MTIEHPLQALLDCDDPRDAVKDALNKAYASGADLDFTDLYIEDLVDMATNGDWSALVRSLMFASDPRWDAARLAARVGAWERKKARTP